MTAKIIDGKQIASAIKEQVAKAVKKRVKKGLAIPGLAVVLVGEDPASAVYVNSKHKACEKAGFYSKVIKLPKSTSEKKLLEIIHKLNKDKKIHGILVQSPLPKKINFQNIIEAIDPKKDVDGFNPYNLGRLAQRHPTLRPCTPYGIIKMLKTTGIELKGKDATIIGASTIVGLPMTLELLMEDATPMVCHIYTKNLAKKIKDADIVIAAAGVPHLIKGSWIKKGAIVIDVGINRLPNGKLVGDVEFEKAKKNASWISPVPGGVGPMTIAMLLSNTLLTTDMSD